ncbi:MAG TPA: hypothetical protein DIC42_00230 [Holosporales bacterium]|nr:hypothetical protein [Holosporales bacterium]
MKKIGLGLVALLVNVSIMQGATLESSAGTDTNALPVVIQSPYHAMADHVKAINDQNIDARLYTSLDYILMEFMFQHGFGLMFTDPKFAQLPAMDIFKPTFVNAVTEGTDGYTQDPDFLKTLSELGWDYARQFYIRGLNNGDYGVTPNADAITRLADSGWKDACQICDIKRFHKARSTTEGYDELRCVADNGDRSAQSDIVRMTTSKARVAHLKALVALGWDPVCTPEAIKEAEKKYGVKEDATGLQELVKLGWPSAHKAHFKGITEGLYGIEQNPDELKRLAEQRRVADLEKPYNKRSFFYDIHNPYALYLKGLAEGTYGICQDPDELKRLAFSGCKYAQSLYVFGLAHGAYGIKQDPAELKRLAEIFREVEFRKLCADGYFDGHGKIADLGYFHNGSMYDGLDWDDAHAWYIEGLAHGEYGFKQNPEELIRLKYLDWRALWRVVRGYAHGEFGIEKNLDALKDLGDRGSLEARRLFAEALLEQNSDDLKVLADSGCPVAQKVYVEGAMKNAGLRLDHAELKQLAQKGWKSAQTQYFKILLMQYKNTEAVQFLNGILLQETPDF